MLWHMRKGFRDLRVSFPDGRWDMRWQCQRCGLIIKRNTAGAQSHVAKHVRRAEERTARVQLTREEEERQMAKQSQLDRAIEQVQREIDMLRQVESRLLAQRSEKPAAKRSRPRAVKPAESQSA